MNDIAEPPVTELVLNIHYEIQMIRDYYKSVMLLHKKELANAFSRLQPLPDRFDDNQSVKEQVDLLLADREHLQFSAVFPRILKYSLFNLCYSFLEVTLNELCERLRLENNHKLKLKDLSDRGVRGAKLYLEKVVEISNIDKSLWKKIEIYAKIRNKIVHCDGHLNYDRHSKAIREFSKKNPERMQVDHSMIVLADEFIPDFLLNDIGLLYYDLQAVIGDRWPGNNLPLLSKRPKD